jgi:hypothetical protein
VLQVASTALTLTAPWVGEIYTVATGDPGDASEVQNIVAEVQSDMAAASTLIAQSHSSPDATTYQKLANVLGSVNANLGALLAAGHIKNPETLAKVTKLSGLITGEISAIIQSLPKAATPAA